jgi:hypothetical protein
MASSFLLETLRGTQVNGLQIRTPIVNLSRFVELLIVDIEHGEAQAGVSDASDPACPVLAQSLRMRRENIWATIAMLENLRAPNVSVLDTTAPRGGAGDHLTEHRVRGLSRTKARLPLRAR